MQANLFLKLICYPLCRCCGLILELKTPDIFLLPSPPRSLVVPKSYAAGLKMYCPGGALFQTGLLKSPAHDYEQQPCQPDASVVTLPHPTECPACPRVVASTLF